MCSYGSDEGEIEFLGLEEHIGAWISVEHEFALAVVAEGDEGQGRTSAFFEDNAVHSDSVLLQYSGEHVTELVVAELAYEGGAAAEPGHGDGDVGGSATGGHEESRRHRQGHAGHCWNEVYQHLAEAHDEALARLGNDVVGRHCVPSS